MNLYTQLTPAKFDPLSLNEVMMVPLAKQKMHDDTVKASSDELNRLYQVQALEPHNEVVKSKIGELETGLNNLTQGITREGINRGYIDQFTKLKSTSDKELSPQGTLGQSNLAYKAFQESKARSIQNMVNQDYDPIKAAENWKKHSANYANQFLETGKIVPIEDRQGLLKQDLQKEVLDIKARLGRYSSDNQHLGDLKVIDVNGETILVDNKGKQVAWNDNNINIKNAYDALNSRFFTEGGEGYNYLVDTGKNIESEKNYTINMLNSYRVREDSSKEDRSTQHIRQGKRTDEINQGQTVELNAPTLETKSTYQDAITFIKDNKNNDDPAVQKQIREHENKTFVANRKLVTDPEFSGKFLRLVEDEKQLAKKYNMTPNDLAAAFSTPLEAVEFNINTGLNTKYPNKDWDKIKKFRQAKIKLQDEIKDLKDKAYSKSSAEPVYLTIDKSKAISDSGKAIVAANNEQIGKYLPEMLEQQSIDIEGYTNSNGEFKYVKDKNVNLNTSVANVLKKASDFDVSISKQGLNNRPSLRLDFKNNDDSDNTELDGSSPTFGIDDKIPGKGSRNTIYIDLKYLKDGKVGGPVKVVKDLMLNQLKDFGGEAGIALANEIELYSQYQDIKPIPHTSNNAFSNNNSLKNAISSNIYSKAMFAGKTIDFEPVVRNGEKIGVQLYKKPIDKNSKYKANAVTWNDFITPESLNNSNTLSQMPPLLLNKVANEFDKELREKGYTNGINDLRNGNVSDEIIDNLLLEFLNKNKNRPVIFNDAVDIINTLR